MLAAFLCTAALLPVTCLCILFAVLFTGPWLPLDSLLSLLLIHLLVTCFFMLIATPFSAS